MAYVRVRIPFVKKLPGIAIVKLRYKYHIGTMRVKLDNNQSILRIINNTDETIHYTPQLSMGIVNIRSLVIGTVYPNIPLSSASIHGHPRSSLGATLGVRMSVTAYGSLSTVSSV